MSRESSTNKNLPADAELRRLHLSPYEEIYEKIYRRIGKLIEKQKKGEAKDSMDEALEIVNTTFNIIHEKLKSYEKFYRIVSKRDDLRAYISIVLGEQALNSIERAARLDGKVRQLYSTLKNELLSGDRRNLRNKALEISSRLISIVRRNRKLLSEVLEIKKEALLFPDISSKVTIVIAGAPNSGKSTLASRISNARTEIAEYPFSTKIAVPGRFLAEDILDIAVLDTPGIIHESLSEMSLFERRAVAVLRMSRGILLFLIDPTDSAALSLDEQIKILSRFREEVAELMVIVNKVDAVNEEKLSIVRDEIKKYIGNESVYFISATERIGLEPLIKALQNRAREIMLRGLDRRGAEFGN
ncbi:MAG: GTPase [Fervidicoccaceae archaeon]